MTDLTQYSIAGICLALIGVITAGIKILARIWKDHNHTTNRVIDVVDKNSTIIQQNTSLTDETRKDIARLVDLVIRTKGKE